MAEDELETPEEDAENTASGRNKIKWIVIALLVFLLAALSVAATLWVLSDAGSDAESGDKRATEPASREVAIYFPLKPEFITSFEVRGRQRYLQVEISLMLRDNSAVKDIELHMPAIRNALVILLRGQYYPELQTPEGKELLRQQALNTVREVLQTEIGKPVIEQVLFTNLVLQ